MIENESDRNITLRTSALAARRVDRNAATRIVAEAAARAPGVAAAFTQDDLQRGGASSLLEEKVKRSFYPGRSGDVFYVLKPYYIDAEDPPGRRTGNHTTTARTCPCCSTEAPSHRETYYSEASPADIAPTLSAVTGVEFPAGREGRVLVEAFKTDQCRSGEIRARALSLEEYSRRRPPLQRRMGNGELRIHNEGRTW